MLCSTLFGISDGGGGILVCAAGWKLANAEETLLYAKWKCIVCTIYDTRFNHLATSPPFFCPGIPSFLADKFQLSMVMAVVSLRTLYLSLFGLCLLLLLLLSMRRKKLKTLPFSVELVCATFFTPNIKNPYELISYVFWICKRKSAHTQTQTHTASNKLCTLTGISDQKISLYTI